MTDEAKFTINEIRAYLSSQDSLGDVLYFLSAENIEKANEEVEEVEEVEEIEGIEDDLRII